MDGGTGSEIHRRGVDVMVGSSTNMLGTWSATANVEAPDVVQQIHADYMRVGADIVTTNTVFTTPTRMAVAGLDDRWQEYASVGRCERRQGTRHRKQRSLCGRGHGNTVGMRAEG